MWVVYGPENGYNFPCRRLLRVNPLLISGKETSTFLGGEGGGSESSNIITVCPTCSPFIYLFIYYYFFLQLVFPFILVLVLLGNEEFRMFDGIWWSYVGFYISFTFSFIKMFFLLMCSKLRVKVRIFVELFIICSPIMIVYFFSFCKIFFFFFLFFLRLGEGREGL